MAIKIQSSLNEIDVEMGNILLKEMRIADTRTIEKTQTPLWDSDNVILVDELEIEEIFRAWLIKNSKKKVDVQYPILAYAPNDIDEVFYGTGNRVHQWEFVTETKDESWAVGDLVWVIDGFYRGDQGTITEINLEKKTAKVNMGGDNVYEFPFDQLRPTGEKLPQKFKAKQIITSYDSVILCEQKQEARYFMNNFILRCADGQIWHPFNSDILNGSELHIFTVFGIPNMKKYPTSDAKLKGAGYIYGVSFRTQVWAYLTDFPVPNGFIEQIRENIHVETDGLVQKIVIN